MKRRAGSLRFWAVTIILIAVTASCCAGTALSRTDFSERELERYYREMERQLVEEAGEYLTRQGYENSGVMLTRVVDMDGSREYTLSIHHARIARLNEKEREQLTGGLRELAFTDQDCDFSIRVLQSCSADG